MQTTSETQISEAQQQNLEFAHEVSRQTRADPNSPYTGKYLGIAERQVVVVADSWDEMHAQLNELGCDRRERVGIEASADYERPIMFWNPRLSAVDNGETGVSS